MKETTLCQRLLAVGILIFAAVLSYVGFNHLFGITGVWKIFTFIFAIHLPLCFVTAVHVLDKLEEETKDLPSMGGSEGWW